MHHSMEKRKIVIATRINEGFNRRFHRGQYYSLLWKAPLEYIFAIETKCDLDVQFSCKFPCQSVVSYKCHRRGISLEMKYNLTIFGHAFG